MTAPNDPNQPSPSEDDSSERLPTRLDGLPMRWFYRADYQQVLVIQAALKAISPEGRQTAYDYIGDRLRDGDL